MASWAIFLLAGGTAALAAPAGDWPQFRGPGGQGTSAAKGLPAAWSAEKDLVWKTELPGPGASSPIVLGERIFVTAYSGYAVPGAPRGELDDLRRHVLCLRRSDGKVAWRKDVEPVLPEEEKVREHGYAASTPAADAQRLYVFFGKTGLIAYTHEGREAWRADVGSKSHGWGSAASPVLHKDLVIVNAAVESESLVALDRESGKEVWRAGGLRESWNTPILVDAGGGKTELVLAIFGKVLGFDPASGDQLWSCATGIGWYMVPSLVKAGDIIYCIGGRTGGALAVRGGGRGDVTKTHRLWTLSKGSNVSSPLLHEGHLYWIHENLGIACCVEAATGKLVYEERIDGAGQVYASPVLADGKIYHVSRRGHLVVVAAKPRFERLASTDLGDRSTFDASPVVDGNRLLARSDRFLYCLGKK
ncbi:MAG: PQQ-binding-like beta-propeller repeat protein [Planctomycetes bacterium]|nr:PQQ-binding-like beta-propeller repeat protein [Planctomycetota bacterium]